jgi:hypothetical protein
VPLRSTLKIGLAAQDPKDVFAEQEFGSAAGLNADVQLVANSERGTSGTAAQGGNPGAGRALASANGFESMRNPGAGVSAVASGGIELKAAASFSTGVSAGVGVSAGAGIGAGIAIGSGAGASVGGGLGARVGESSLQVFAGLGATKTPTSARLDTRALAPAAGAASVSTGFALGGRATSASSSGLKADMGTTIRIRFDS